MKFKHSLPAFLAIALLAASLSGFGIWKVQGWRHDSQEKERVEAAIEKAKFDRRTVDNAAASHEADKGAIQTKYVTVTKEVERVVKEPFYVAGQCLDADGLRVLSEAIGPAAAASQPASAVRPDKPAH